MARSSRGRRRVTDVIPRRWRTNRGTVRGSSMTRHAAAFDTLDVKTLPVRTRSIQ